MGNICTSNCLLERNIFLIIIVDFNESPLTLLSKYGAQLLVHLKMKYFRAIKIESIILLSVRYFGNYLTKNLKNQIIFVVIISLHWKASILRLKLHATG